MRDKFSYTLYVTLYIICPVCIYPNDTVLFSLKNASDRFFMKKKNNKTRTECLLLLDGLDFGRCFPKLIIIIRCQIWNRHWRSCLSKHLCHQTTSKNLNPYFVHLLPSYKDYQEMLFVVCPYRVCLLLYQLKIRIPSLYVYTHVLKIPFASF